MRSKQPRWIVSQGGGGDTYCTIPPLVVDMRMMIDDPGIEDKSDLDNQDEDGKHLKEAQ